MKKVISMVSFIGLFFLLSGCAHYEKEKQLEEVEQQKTAQRMTVVSSGKPASVLPAFTTFTWNDEYTRVLSAINGNNESEIKTYIKEEIITYLRSKGYVYQSDPIQADVVIGFLFALEDDAADQLIQEKFGLLPGLNKDVMKGTRYSKGSFLLALLDTDLKQVYWRSAMQGFVDLEKDKNDPETDRMQAILRMMMGDFPKAGR